MSDVGTYYDSNTRSFLRFGKGRTRAIHRALRAPGVRTIHEAYHVVEEIILREIRPLLDGSEDPPIVADLGCGVGASIEYLTGRLAAEGLRSPRFVGITLSEVQASLAGESLAAGSPDGAHRVIAGDFTDDAPYRELLGDALLHAAYLIESWNHAPDAAGLLDRIAAHMRPGGLLAICDDIPRDEVFRSDLISQRENRLLGEFRRGWHVKTFLPVSGIIELAGDHGFSHLRCDDLSDWVVLDRPRDRLVRVAAHIARIIDRGPRDGPFRTPWWDNLRGGDALQQLEKRRRMSYQICFFVRE